MIKPQSVALLVLTAAGTAAGLAIALLRIKGDGKAIPDLLKKCEQATETLEKRMFAFSASHASGSSASK